MTLSLLAHDRGADTLGVAIASLRFNVAQSVITTEAGVGIACSQHLSDPAFGRSVLATLRSAVGPAAALETWAHTDAALAVHQLGVLAADGQIAALTGPGCVGAAAHCIRVGRSAQGAILADEGVLDIALDAFDSAPGTLSRRLLTGLAAGVAAGGDQRGHRAAAVIVIWTMPGLSPTDRVLDLQVPDPDDPVAELTRLLTLHELDAEVVGALGLALGGEVAGALVAFDRIQHQAPDLLDAASLHAMLLAAVGDHARARERFRVTFATEAGWVRYATRLRDAGFLQLSSDEMALLTSEGGSVSAE